MECAIQTDSVVLVGTARISMIPSRLIIVPSSVCCFTLLLFTVTISKRMVGKPTI